jgi:hypothetical protein
MELFPLFLYYKGYCGAQYSFISFTSLASFSENQLGKDKDILRAELISKSLSRKVESPDLLPRRIIECFYYHLFHLN